MTISTDICLFFTLRFMTEHHHLQLLTIETCLGEISHSSTILNPQIFYSCAITNLDVSQYVLLNLPKISR